MQFAKKKKKANTRDELLAGIFDAAACVKEREVQHRRTKHDLRSRVAKTHSVGWWDFRTFIAICNQPVRAISA